jgi:hypothetical protein
MGRILRREMWAMAAAVTVMLTGCDAPGSEPSPSPSAMAATAVGPAEAAQQAIATWQGMWRAYVKAGLTANASEPDLARYAADRALATLVDGLESYATKGQILKGDLVTNPEVADVSPSINTSTVTIADCLDTTAFLVYEDDELADDEPGGRRSAMGTVTLLSDGWRVTSFGIQEVGTCAIASRTSSS